MDRNFSPEDDRDRARTSESIPVVEERLNLGSRKEATGKVRAVKRVNEENLVISGSVVNDEFEIERIPRNEVVESAPPPVRHEGDTMIITVVQEEVMVQTRLVVVEEVRITKRRVNREVEIPVTLRKEEVVVERLKGDGFSEQK